MSLGLWAGLIAYRHNFIPKQFIALSAFGFVGILYYLSFFASLADHLLGLWVTYAIYVAGGIFLLYGLSKINRVVRNRDLALYIFLPVFIMITLTGYYTFLLSSCRLPSLDSPKDDNKSYCYVHMLPGDNELAYDYGKNVLNNHPEALISDWKLVDRPPIQIGAGIGILDLNNKHKESYRAYQLVGTFLQLSWVAAVFGLLITLGVSMRQTLLMIGILSMSGFIFINSIFVWPKFFAAGLVVMAVALLFDTSNKHYKRTLISAIAAISLGLLTHDGVVFTIIGVALVFAYMLLAELYKHKGKWPRLPWRSILAGCSIGLVLLAPWAIYKNSHSSSDHLVKWHLAGVVKTDNRSTVRTIVDSYKAITPRTWYDNRIANIKMLYEPFEKPELPKGIKAFGFSNDSIKSSLSHLSLWYQQNDFYIVFLAFGVLNLGWIAVFSKKNRKHISSLEKRLLATSFISLFIWVIVMFLPSSTVLHQGSYATFLIIFSLLGTWLARNKLLLPIFVFQFLIFNIFWVLGIFARYNLSLHEAIPSLFLSLVVALLFLGLAKVVPKFIKAKPRTL